MNNEDMSEVFKSLSGMLNSNNIPDNVKDVLSNLQNSNSSSDSVSSNNSNVSSENPSSNGISKETFEMLSSMLNNSGSTNGNTSNNSTSSDGSGIDMETLLKIGNIISKMNSSENDARANLLLSLKPYLKESRKNKVEQYVKLLNMSKVLEIINPNGSEKVK